ncbi:uncharacterized protein LOC126405328 [Epinephelus moara]|uniref:uncharacterized protein LOC126405328 n=1 Tax=Epinephelus moara TaxID=300413 RepID=UPI00214F4AD8|nr:uncharacterized protein LOC126405328 [Epinephelus moara]
MSCSAFGCTKRSSKGSDVNFFRFPLANSDRLKQWLMNVRRKNWTPSKSSRLCSTHFEESEFLIDRKGQRRLKDNAVPTIFSFPHHLLLKKEATKAKRIKSVIPPVPSCSAPMYLSQPHTTPGPVAYLHSVLDNKAVSNSDNEDTDNKDNIFMRDVHTDVDDADDITECTISAEPERVMHDHDYLARDGKAHKQISVRPDHSYIISGSPSTVRWKENVVQDQLDSDPSITPERKDSAVQVHLLSETPITLIKENALRHKLVIVRKKLKLKCQQTRRMKAKLLSLKALTKVLQKKMTAYEKAIAAFRMEVRCKKCEKSRSRYLL